MALILASSFQRREWRQPSQRSTLAGIENQTFFRVQARAQDGALYWRGYFEDYDDADVFLWSLARHQSCGDAMPNSIARLPRPGRGPHTGWASSFYGRAKHEGEWQPGFAELPLAYEFATVEFLTATGSSTWTSPSTWNANANTMEGIGGGGSGGIAMGNATQLVARGGGGGGYAKLINHLIESPGTTTRFVAVGAAEGGKLRTTTGDTNGSSGSHAIVQDASPGTLLLRAYRGGGGGANSSSTANTVDYGGGVQVASTGDVIYLGGDSGACSNPTANVATGGGGAAGNTADGGDGVDSNGGATNGGDGGATGGSAHGSGSTGTGNRTGGDGAANASNFDDTHGAGGGGGGARSTNAGSVDGGDGALYGGGGAGAVTTATTGTQTSGGGAQAILVFTHTPAHFMYALRRNVFIKG